MGGTDRMLERTGSLVGGAVRMLEMTATSSGRGRQDVGEDGYC